MTDPLISFQGVSFVKHPGTDREVVALRDVTLTIEKGECVAIVGRNGSGKTTLAKHMNALFLPTAGTVLIDGMDTQTHDDNVRFEIRRRVQMVFQNPDHQMVSQVVQEEVAFGPENLAIDPEEIRERVDAALKLVRLTDYRHASPHMLSGGQKQRLAIACTLAMQPACIVFDEATTMLDPQGQGEVMDTVLRLNQEQGLTVILITHSMEEAARTRRVVVMSQGQVARDGPPADIFADGPGVDDLGLQLPAMALLADRLHDRGLDVPGGLHDVDAVASFLARKYRESGQ